MKKAFIFLAVMPLALLALSCTKDLEGPAAPVNYEKVSFVASFDEPATKTSVNTASGKVFWKEGDLIRYYSESGGEVFNLNVGTILDSGTTQIDLNLSQSSPFGIAVYGGTGLADRENDGCTVEGAITAEQSGTFEGAHVAVAKVKKTNDQWPETIRFSNVVPLVSFELEGTADGAEYAIFKTGANERIHANGLLYVSFDGTNVSEVSLPTQGGGSSIQIPISGAKVYYIALAPGTYHGINLSFYKKNGAGVDEYLGTVASDKTLNLTNRKALVKLGAIDAKIERVSTDLSAAGEANCYVVSEPGDYKIPVSQNGAASKVVVWESTMTAEAPVAGNVVYNVDLKDGYLHFASGVDGNAVIGVTDDEAAILWSWHIWVCKGYDPAASAITTANGKVMDRALGALDDKSAGLLYQWGRKDPFLAPGLASNPEFKAPIISTEKNGTVAKAIKYPSTLINPDSVTEGDWVYAARDNSLWASVKSDYDPCPAGWQLPAEFGEDAQNWVAGEYWSCATNGAKAILWNGTELVASNRASLAMVRCVAGNKVDVTGVTLNKTSITVNPSESVNLSATITPDNASVKTVNWSVAPTGVVSIQNVSDNEIQVTGVAVGECTITAEADKVKATCTVVCGVPVESVSLSPAYLVVAPQASKQLTVSITPAEATVQAVDVTVSPSGVVTVEKVSDKVYTVTGVAEGECVITATTHNGLTATCNVEVASHKVVNLSSGGTANCYIVSEPGDYCFYAKVRGNSSNSIGDPVKVEELWGTFNNTTAPRYNEMIKDLSLEDNLVYFTVPDPMINGNVVIAVRDAQNEILWSWHIWLSEGFSPEATEQHYFNSSAVMMDRNLGALSATIGDIQSVGLLYQWGRKDPFPGASSFTGKNVPQCSTSTSWPQPVNAGSIAYSIANPMRFMLASTSHQDWYAYESSDSPRVDDRWARDKTEFDPCPPGWRVPDGGGSGIWSTGFARSDGFVAANKWLGGRYGYDFNGLLANTGDLPVWYPVSAYLTAGAGSIMGQGQYSMYWACTTPGWIEDYQRMDDKADIFYFYTNSSIQPSASYARAQGCAVRCLKDGTFYGVPLVSFSVGEEGQTEYSCTIKLGQTYALPLIFNPSNASNKALRAVSLDTTYVDVDNNGNVTGVKITVVPIQVTITAADGRRVVTCKISVVGE